jgi:hypothetical protein
LDTCELVEYGRGSETRGQRLEPDAQNVQAVGQESDEDVRLNAMLELMVVSVPTHSDQWFRWIPITDSG